MSNLHQQDQAFGISASNSDRNIFYPTLSGITTTTATTTPSRPAALVDQKLCESCNLKRNKELLERKMATLRLEIQKQLVNELVFREAQKHSTPLTENQLRMPKTISQRNPDLFKTTLCHFWSNGIPCRYGEHCWFAHGVHELRIASFVYPGLHRHDYEVRMNSANRLASLHGRNLERNCSLANVQSNVQSAPATIVGRNVPTDIFHRLSPIHENVNSMNWSTTQRGVSGGDSGIENTSTNNSPEILQYRKNLNDATHQFIPFQEPPLPVAPPHMKHPTDTSINGGQTNSSDEPYNYWLSTGTAQSNDMKVASSLEEMSWWSSDIFGDAYPSINRPSQNIQHNRNATQPNHNATQSMNEHCYSTCTKPKIDKTEG
ncbi:unnamed protein product [Onchocerca flexuosa]|uniref:C3H1-type domain-containing protein n=1 Tax=Onchocerca flexuosa TaxID=387005 RepID=A0A183HCF4_9BILA|nr:unnamed protein product [Onchocerca flexuosa]